MNEQDKYKEPHAFNQFNQFNLFTPCFNITTLPPEVAVTPASTCMNELKQKFTIQLLPFVSCDVFRFWDFPH